MQDTNLCWAQAKNMLLAGICKSIRYVPNQGCANSFENVGGVIHRRYDPHPELCKPGEPSIANIRRFKFEVKDWQ